MAVVETARPTGPRMYGNWRRPTSAGLMGLGSLGTALLLAGLIMMIFVIMFGGLERGLIVAVLILTAMGVVLLRDRHGRNVLDRTTARAAWWQARSAGSHLYRSGPLGRTPWGTHQLPGLGAALTLSEHHDSYGRPFVLVHSPGADTYTVVLATEPDGASLVDTDQVDIWVADWGHWLAHLADEPNIEAIAVTIETAPDTGSRLRREVGMNVDPDAPDFARAMLNEVIELYPAGSSSVRAYVALTFNSASRASGKKRPAEEVGRDLASRLPGLTYALGTTGAGAARPLMASELCELVRVAYDPHSQQWVDECHAQGVPTGLTWAEVGPSAAEATWDGYRHDGAFSVTWAMTTAPRGNVQSGVLARLLAPHRDIARKRVTICYKPIDAARAAAIVEADLRSAEFRASSSNRPSARDSLAVRQAASTAAEEAAGSGLVNFGLLVTATVLDPDHAPEARAAVDNLSATARLRLRPMYGSQDVGFIGALPLGLILSKHLRVPAELRDRL